MSYSVWFFDSEFRVEALANIGMEAALHTERSWGRARDRAMDEAVIAFYQEPMAWLAQHHTACRITDEARGLRMHIEFDIEHERDEFLLAHPMWTLTRPRMWYDAAIE